MQATGTCIMQPLKVLRTSPSGTHTAGTEGSTSERELVQNPVEPVECPVETFVYFPPKNEKSGGSEATNPVYS